MRFPLCITHARGAATFPMSSLVFGTSSDRIPFSSILQVVASTSSNTSLIATSTDFKSMEDLPDSSPQVYSNSVRSLLSRSNSIPSTRSRHTVSPGSTPTHLSEESRIDNRRATSSSASSGQGKSNQDDTRSFKKAGSENSIAPGEHHRRSLSSTHLPMATVFGRPKPSPEKTFSRRTSQADARYYSSQLPSVDEASVAFQSIGSTSHNASVGPTTITPHSLPTKHTIAGKGMPTVASPDDPQARRKSLDLSLEASNTGIKRLKRSQSMWTTSLGHKPARSDLLPDLPDFRAEAQMSERQRLLTVKRARKIAQVFGREVPANLIQGQGPDDENFSASRRDSVITVISSPLLSTTPPTRRRSGSTSSSTSDSRSRPSFEISLDQSTEQPPSGTVTNNQDLELQPPLPPSTFNERRRRAAKLSHFFGVNYQDISTSLNNVGTPAPPPSVETYDLPSAEVDVQVAGRRFWGFTDNRGQMKAAEMADVIDKLRDLKAA